MRRARATRGSVDSGARLPPLSARRLSPALLALLTHRQAPRRAACFEARMPSSCPCRPPGCATHGVLACDLSRGGVRRQRLRPARDGDARYEQRLFFLQRSRSLDSSAYSARGARCLRTGTGQHTSPRHTLCWQACSHRSRQASARSAFHTEQALQGRLAGRGALCQIPIHHQRQRAATPARAVLPRLFSAGCESRHAKAFLHKHRAACSPSQQPRARRACGTQPCVCSGRRPARHAGQAAPAPSHTTGRLHTERRRFYQHRTGLFYQHRTGLPASAARQGGRACQATACRRRHAPRWPARQAALWHTGEQKRAMLQPEHSCSGRPASDAPASSPHLRVHGALVTARWSGRQGWSRRGAARTPTTSSPRGGARAWPGAGPPS